MTKIDDFIYHTRRVIYAAGGGWSVEKFKQNKEREVREFLEAFAPENTHELFGADGDTEGPLHMAALAGYGVHYSLPGKKGRDVILRAWNEAWQGGSGSVVWRFYEWSGNLMLSFLPKEGRGYVEIDFTPKGEWYRPSPLSFPLEVDVVAYRHEEDGRYCEPVPFFCEERLFEDAEPLGEWLSEVLKEVVL